jgi:hypothetical protein
MYGNTCLIDKGRFEINGWSNCKHKYSWLKDSSWRFRSCDFLQKPKFSSKFRALRFTYVLIIWKRWRYRLGYSFRRCIILNKLIRPKNCISRTYIQKCWRWKDCMLFKCRRKIIKNLSIYNKILNKFMG